MQDDPVKNHEQALSDSIKLSLHFSLQGYGFGRVLNSIAFFLGDLCARRELDEEDIRNFFILIREVEKFEIENGID